MSRRGWPSWAVGLLAACSLAAAVVAVARVVTWTDTVKAGTLIVGAGDDFSVAAVGHGVTVWSPRGGHAAMDRDGVRLGNGLFQVSQHVWSDGPTALLTAPSRYTAFARVPFGTSATAGLSGETSPSSAHHSSLQSTLGDIRLGPMGWSIDGGITTIAVAKVVTLEGDPLRLDLSADGLSGGGEPRVCAYDLNLGSDRAWLCQPDRD